jgi:RNA polymerase sigma-70 factor, ECF subfamily
VIAEFFQTRMARWGSRVPRLVPTRANDQPAFGYYLADPDAPAADAHSLIVLTLAGNEICAITRFGDTACSPASGCPGPCRAGRYAQRLTAVSRSTRDSF